MIEDIKLITTTAKGTRLRVGAQIDRRDGRIWFRKSPFALKDEIKAMKGSRWHGYDDPPMKVWSIEACQRNDFNLQYMQGENVFEWFDRAVQTFGSRHPLMPHQFDMSDAGLTYHYQIWAAEMGTGKTLAAQNVIELSGQRHWYWIGPKTSLPNIRREFNKWNFDWSRFNIEFMTYEHLVKIMDAWQDGTPLPGGVIFDESSKVKTANAQRTKAGQFIADLIRDHYGVEGFVILMSGTPSPKSPVDWWAQAEIAWPGFLKEGSPQALQKRLAFITQETDPATGMSFPRQQGWKDDPRKCGECGEYDEAHDECMEDFHPFVPARNEVALMYERLKGLVVIKHKKDCLSLPEKRYRVVECKPKPATLRVASALVRAAPNTITGLTWLRELSDGFQYREKVDGTVKCTHCESGSVGEWFDPDDEERVFRSVDMLDEAFVNRLEKRDVACPICGGSQQMPRKVRTVREVPCPKDAALEELLTECEETGRIVIFAGFTGAVDRIEGLCHKNNWSVVRVDGRGWKVTDGTGTQLDVDEPLDYWSDLEVNPRVAFVAHPESGGMSLTLTESRMAVFWSNSFKPEFRVQAEDRIHRKGMDENLGCTIVDLIHLPSDERVRNVIRDNRRLELMTLGELAA